MLGFTPLSSAALSSIVRFTTAVPVVINTPVNQNRKGKFKNTTRKGIIS